MSEPEQPDQKQPAPAPRQDEQPVLEERAAEDRDESWGDAGGGREDEWYLRERPPHHGD